LSNKLKT